MGSDSCLRQPAKGALFQKVSHNNKTLCRLLATASRSSSVEAVDLRVTNANDSPVQTNGASKRLVSPVSMQSSLQPMASAGAAIASLAAARGLGGAADSDDEDQVLWTAEDGNRSNEMLDTDEERDQFDIERPLVYSLLGTGLSANVVSEAATPPRSIGRRRMSTVTDATRPSDLMGRRTITVVKEAGTTLGFKLKTVALPQRDKSGYVVPDVSVEATFVFSVDPDRPAHAAGLRAGDQILTVGPHNCLELKHEYVVRLIKAQDGPLVMQVKYTKDYRRAMLHRHLALLRADLKENMTLLEHVSDQENALIQRVAVFQESKKKAVMASLSQEFTGMLGEASKGGGGTLLLKKKVDKLPETPQPTTSAADVHPPTRLLPAVSVSVPALETVAKSSAPANEGAPSELGAGDDIDLCTADVLALWPQRPAAEIIATLQQAWARERAHFHERECGLHAQCFPTSPQNTGVKLVAARPVVSSDLDTSAFQGQHKRSLQEEIAPINSNAVVSGGATVDDATSPAPASEGTRRLPTTPSTTLSAPSRSRATSRERPPEMVDPPPPPPTSAELERGNVSDLAFSLEDLPPPPPSYDLLSPSVGEEMPPPPPTAELLSISQGCAGLKGIGHSYV